MRLRAVPALFLSLAPAACDQLREPPPLGIDGACLARIVARQDKARISAILPGKGVRLLGFTPVSVERDPAVEFYLVEAEGFYSQTVPARCGRIDVELEPLADFDEERRESSGEAK